MNQIINYVSDFFGIIMRWCYVFVNNYGLSIIVFTIFTKFVLFPISLITQKNSIKMAQMRPELDALKVKYVDDKDRYADAQLELYKKMQYHPLLDMIPLLIQILIVLGLVGVMYCPLSYILRMQDPDIAMLQKWFEGLGWTLQDNSYQLTMIHEIQNGISGVPENLMGLIEKISDFDMNFIGFNLSEKPQLSLHNKLVLIPVLSGVSAWLMCVVQNKINVLQLYAGKWNKIGMTVFMIAFSTYFAFLVPAGVGVYWIFGNLFAIPSMYLVNIVMPPEKYIDMDYIRILNETAEEKEKITSQIIADALCGFKNRKEKLYGTAPAEGEKRVNVMAQHGFDKSITGLSEDTLVAALGGTLQPLIDAIVSGKIKGIAAVVGCSNLRAKGHDVFTVELAKELIKKDILVLSAGCTCGGLENCGLMTMDAVELCGEGLKEICTALGVPPVLNFGPCLAIGRIEMAACALAKELNVDLPQLPVVISAPQWLEEQALADGAYALALGFPLHLALSPFVTGSQVAVNVLTEGLKDLTGGQLIIETEVDAAAQKFEDIIKEKRAGLGIDNGINKGGDAIC